MGAVQMDTLTRACQVTSPSDRRTDASSRGFRPGTARRTRPAGFPAAAQTASVSSAGDVAVPDALAEGQFDAVEVLEQGGHA
jgi:hypothetical protein